MRRQCAYLHLPDVQLLQQCNLFDILLLPMLRRSCEVCATSFGSSTAGKVLHKQLLQRLIETEIAQPMA